MQSNRTGFLAAIMAMAAGLSASAQAPAAQLAGNSRGRLGTAFNGESHVFGKLGKKASEGKLSLGIHGNGKRPIDMAPGATERKRERQRVAKMSNVPDGKPAGHKMLDTMARAKSLHERQKWRDARYEQRVHAGVQF